MNKEPETYEELIRRKRCINLTKYYELTQDDLNEIYNFLETHKDGYTKCGSNTILFMINGNSTPIKVINTKCIDATIDGIVMSDSIFNIIPHYVPTSYSGYSGGSSSNNNNNNNNHNNNNNR